MWSLFPSMSILRNAYGSVSATSGVGASSSTAHTHAYTLCQPWLARARHGWHHQDQADQLSFYTRRMGFSRLSKMIRARDPQKPKLPDHARWQKSRAKSKAAPGFGPLEQTIAIADPDFLWYWRHLLPSWPKALHDKILEVLSFVGVTTGHAECSAIVRKLIASNFCKEYLVMVWP